MICVSWVKPLGKSGRSGRSISREVRISFSVGRPSRLNQPPGDAPGGVGVLAVVDGQGEEVGVLLRLLGEDGGDQDDGVAVADDGGAVGLLGELADLDVERERPERNGCLV